jgi:prolyl 4-hydroxylase
MKSYNDFKCDYFVTRLIEDRAATLVGLPSAHVEPLQIVSYTKGQYFNLHHDAGTLDEDEETVELVPPKRIITLFVYLNDVSDEGEGSTEFPYLGVKVQPLKGKKHLHEYGIPSDTYGCV